MSLIVVGVIGCSANDPVYVQCPTTATTQPECIANLEAGMDDGTGTDTVVAKAKSRLLLPITLEKADDMAARMALAAQLGVDVPYVKLGDIEVEVEWTVKNLEDMEGEAKVELNGATELFEYDPDMIVLSDDDEAPPTPPLTGNTPIHIPAGATVSGTIREDEVKEASIDIEQVTRANVNPFKATLTINKNDKEIIPYTLPDPTMPDVPPMPDLNAVHIPRAYREHGARGPRVRADAAHGARVRRSRA